MILSFLVGVLIVVTGCVLGQVKKDYDKKALNKLVTAKGHVFSIVTAYTDHVSPPIYCGNCGKWLPMASKMVKCSNCGAQVSISTAKLNSTGVQ